MFSKGCRDSGNPREYAVGMAGFAMSGVLAIASGIIVSLLRDRFAFSYGLTGTMVSVMNVGNMLALLAAGFLPARIGERASALLLGSGFALGYLLMALTGNPALLLLSFLLVGISKGSTANQCTVLVGRNAADRPKSVILMNAWYALGALLCPFLVAGFGRLGAIAPMLGLSGAGVFFFLMLLSLNLPGKGQGVEAGRPRDRRAFLRSPLFIVLSLLLFCQNGAEYTVSGWLVTYYKNERILADSLASYTVTVQWFSTLVLRLLLARFSRGANTGRRLTVMGLCLTAAYVLLIRMRSPLGALTALALFSGSIAGVYPMAVAAVGKMMSSESIGVMLSFAGLGGIVFPWLVGAVADAAGLPAGMAVNIIPCAGIVVLSFLLFRMDAETH